MKGDFTRDTFDIKKHYSAVRMQQGRVQLDADWNEQADLVNHRIRSGNADEIGAVGGPIGNAGFQIGPGSPVSGNLTIGAGHYYVDGILCENEASNLTVQTQPDLPWLQPLSGAGIYIVYLDVWSRHLTALEDGSIREVALGGPDTATRTKTVWQVKSLAIPTPGPNPTCASTFSDWDNLTASATGKLRARSKPSAASDKPCIVPAAAGYQRLENQLYRVEINKPGDANSATFKWSRDNGSIAAQWLDQTGNVLKVSSLGRDGVLNFASGQFIEIFDDTNELAGAPGTLVKIIDPSPSGQFITIDTAVNRANFPKNPRIRRWDSAPGEIAVKRPLTNDGYIALESGVEVRFEDGAYKTGDYWLIPARTNTGDIEWPAESPGVPAAQPARGIVHRYARLALAQVDASGVKILEDCRTLFPPLASVNTFFFLGGDGQEAAPDPSAPTALLALAQPLRAGVTAGLTGAKVHFEIKVGSGRLQGTGPAVDVAVDSSGVASCAWELDSSTPVQMVEATLLDINGKTAHLPIHYAANLSRADLVSYDPKKCSSLAGSKTVQDALDKLCQPDSGFHVKGLGLHNGNLGIAKDLVLNGSVLPAEFALGIVAACDDSVDAKSVTRANCFAVAEVPFQPDGTLFSGYSTLVLNSTVKVSDNVIIWTPAPFAVSTMTQQAASTAAGGRLLVRFTLKGSSIWAANKPDVALDGDIFADPRVPAGYRLPSGDRRRGGDLEVWFFLAPPANFGFAASAPVPPPIVTPGPSQLVGDVTLTGTGGTAGKSDTINVIASFNASLVAIATAPPQLLIDTAAGPLNGVIANNQITFNNVTFAEPGPAGVRVLRITNVRVNTTPLAGAGVPPQVLASISITGAVAIPIVNPQVVVASVG